MDRNTQSLEYTTPAQSFSEFPQWTDVRASASKQTVGREKRARSGGRLETAPRIVLSTSIRFSSSINVLFGCGFICGLPYVRQQWLLKQFVRPLVISGFRSKCLLQYSTFTVETSGESMMDIFVMNSFACLLMQSPFFCQADVCDVVPIRFTNIGDASISNDPRYGHLKDYFEPPLELILTPRLFSFPPKGLVLPRTRVRYSVKASILYYL